jgi:hypothetical protein
MGSFRSTIGFPDEFRVADMFKLNTKWVKRRRRGRCTRGVLVGQDPQQVLDQNCHATGTNSSQLSTAMPMRQDACYGFRLMLPGASWRRRSTKRNSASVLAPYI